MAVLQAQNCGVWHIVCLPLGRRERAVASGQYSGGKVLTVAADGYASRFYAFYYSTIVRHCCMEGGSFNVSKEKIYGFVGIIVPFKGFLGTVVWMEGRG